MTQSDAPVLYDVQHGVATLQLNRPEASNALDLPLVKSLSEALRLAAAADDVAVLLLLGRGKVFCGGGDVAAMAGSEDRGAFLRELADAAHEVVRQLDQLEKPVVAGVQGAAAGAGLALTLASDLVVAGGSAKFLCAYTAIGLTPDCGTSWLLPQAVGLQRALQLTLTNRALTGAEAQQWGVVTQTCADDQVAATARAVADALAAGPARALGLSRKLLRSARTRSLDEHLDLEAASISAMGTTPEAEALVEHFAGRSRSRESAPGVRR